MKKKIVPHAVDTAPHGAPEKIQVPSLEQFLAVNEHKLWMKIQLTTFQLSEWSIIISATFASSIYTLAFNCDPFYIGLISVFIAFVDIFFNPLAGMCQDNRMLAPFFPLAKWGHLAPWMVTHLPIAIVAVAMILLPPRGSGNEARAETYAWYLLVLLVLKWCQSIINAAGKSAVNDLYPLQKQRVQIVGIGNIMVMTATLSGILGSLIVIGDAENALERCCEIEGDNMPPSCMLNHTFAANNNGSNVFYLAESTGTSASRRVIMSFSMAALTAIGFLSIHPFCDAHPVCAIEAKSLSVSKYLCQLASLLKHGPFMAVFILNMVGALHKSIVAVCGPFFMRFVLGLDRNEYAVMSTAIFLTALISKLVGILVCVWAFGKTSKHENQISINPRVPSIICTIFIGLSFVLGIEMVDAGYNDDGTKAKGSSMILIFIISFNSIFSTPTTFFARAAEAWVIDEDAQLQEAAEYLKKASHREGLFLSSWLIASDVSLMVTATLMAGISLAGIDTVDTCWGESQEKGGIWYIKMLFQVGIPICAVVRIMAMFAFPIHGERLQKIEQIKRGGVLLVSQATHPISPPLRDHNSSKVGPE